MKQYGDENETLVFIHRIVLISYTENIFKISLTNTIAWDVCLIVWIWRIEIEAKDVHCD